MSAIGQVAIIPDLKEIDLSPIFKPLIVRGPGEIDINQIEAISQLTFKVLIEEQTIMQLPYILALVQDAISGWYPIDGIRIWKWTQEHDTNPITLDKIKQIFYFTIQNTDEKLFEYLGHSEEEGEKEGHLYDMLDPVREIFEKQTAYAMIMDQKLGVQKINPKLMFRFFELAAINGDGAIGHRNLSVCYSEGDGVEANQEKAFHHLRISADKGMAQSQYELGCRYKVGNGVKPNIILAIKFFLLADKQNHEEAKESLDQIFRDALELEKKSIEKSSESTIILQPESPIDSKEDKTEELKK